MLRRRSVLCIYRELAPLHSRRPVPQHRLHTPGVGPVSDYGCLIYHKPHIHFQAQLEQNNPRPGGLLTAANCSGIDRMLTKSCRCFGEIKGIRNSNWDLLD
ncbi:hypothetical protein AVEN_100402-1 [Araneus ventricosus]|uniref:Uncharacterized protein n=1 Tax=Araneus ventricosus TaxID=182803 RepID=A0A4Y2JY65_ARAVE|nr:hypothetical protein AVEN_100402-1 [Araneus ventricosus]